VVELLSYDLLDDLCLLLQDTQSIPEGMSQIEAITLGPLLELRHAEPPAFNELCKRDLLGSGRYHPILMMSPDMLYLRRPRLIPEGRMSVSLLLAG
jgi:hypothetical protein